MRVHPVFGDLVTTDDLSSDGCWMIHDAPVALDTVLQLIEDGRTTKEILKCHVLILRKDLVEITMLHALSGMVPCALD